VDKAKDEEKNYYQPRVTRAIVIATRGKNYLDSVKLHL